MHHDRRTAWMFHCIALQNSVQCIANLSHFLCITFSKRRRRESNGRRYFPNNRQRLASIFRSQRARRGATHGHETRTAVRAVRAAANLITFDLRKALLPLQVFNVPETYRSLCARERRTTRTMRRCAILFQFAARWALSVLLRFIIRQFLTNPLNGSTQTWRSFLTKF